MTFLVAVISFIAGVCAEAEARRYWLSKHKPKWPWMQ